MIQRIIILMLVISLTSCNYINEENSCTPKPVTITYRFEGNNYILRGQVNKNNQLHGFAELFTKDGEKKVTGSFFNNKLNGMITVFHEDGSKTISQYFLGKKEGLKFLYYPDGKIRSVTLLKDGAYLYFRDFSVKGGVDTTFRWYDLTYSLCKENKFEVNYKFSDPFFKSGWIDLIFNDTLGQLVNHEKVTIHSCDSSIFSRSLKPNDYQAIIEIYSDLGSEMILRIGPTRKFRAL